MKKKFASLFLPMLLASSFAHTASQDENLIQLDSSESAGFDRINTYLLKNSIKRLDQRVVSFSVLVTGVSADIISSFTDPIAVPEQDLTEYPMDESRVILVGKFDCEKKRPTIDKLISFDQQTNSIKEQMPNNSLLAQDNEQDKKMNLKLYENICTF